MELKCRNVNDAFDRVVRTFKHRGQMDYVTGRPDRVPVVETPSRNGPVLMIAEPVLMIYSHPRERVLFNAARDANPFFHLYESLYMLAGGNLIAPLAKYAKNMANYSDDGVTQNGAYGYRWRYYAAPRSLAQVGDELINPPGSYDLKTRVDQLDVLVDHLTRMPESRRAVLQMWNVEDDLLKIGSDLDIMRGKQSKDVCCNLDVMFSLRYSPKHSEHLVTRRLDHTHWPSPTSEYVLDMTVTNRSNDLVWGMLGANYVHFTFLQEYMAARLGVEVGTYNHFTNNLHVYTETNSGFKPDELLEEYEVVTGRLDYRDRLPPGHVGYAAYSKPWQPFPLVKDAATFDAEVVEFTRHYGGPDYYAEPRAWSEPFLVDVAQPLLQCFQAHKNKAATTAMWCERIAAEDWRIAVRAWLERRYNKQVARPDGAEG